MKTKYKLFAIVPLMMMTGCYRDHKSVVKEVSETYHLEIGKVKLAYDCCSCLVSVLLSFLFFGFGRFEGVKLGTIICSFINGRLIGFLGGVLESRYRFQDALKLRPVFSK